MNDTAEVMHQGDEDAYEAEYYTDIPVGEILRRARMHYGTTLDDVESALRIRSIQLEALEEGRLDHLPGRAYAIGFVRSYSEFLGLDGDKMVHLFKRQSVGNHGRPELSFPVPASESKMPGPEILIGSGVSFIILVGLIVYAMLPSAPQTIPDVPEEMRMAEMSSELPQETGNVPVSVAPPTPAMTTEMDVAQSAPEADGDSTADPAAVAVAPAGAAVTEARPQQPATPPKPAAASSGESRLVVRAVGQAWVEIRDQQGNVLVSRVLEKGNYYLLPNDPNLVMDTGSAGALQIILDGEQLPRLGQVGEIRRSISLDPNNLRRLARGG